MSFQNLLALIFIQWLALALIMSVGWIIWKTTRNSGWIDAIWTLAIGVVGTASAIWWHTLETASVNRWIVAAMIAAWALRLGIHITGRTANITDDPRYAKLVDDWGDKAERNMFGFLQAQAFFGVLLTLAVALAAANPAPLLSAAPLLAIGVYLAGITGSATSDRQLNRFKQIKQSGETDKKVCDIGLWAYSRHPNYFFEFVIWSSFALFALNFSGAWNWGFLAILAPACMYWLLRYVSGVPPLEQHMVARYGDAYRDYQRRVSVFFPWPPSAGPSRLSRAVANSES